MKAKYGPFVQSSEQQRSHEPSNGEAAPTGKQVSSAVKAIRKIFEYSQPILQLTRPCDLQFCCPGCCSVYNLRVKNAGRSKFWVIAICLHWELMAGGCGRHEAITQKSSIGKIAQWANQPARYATHCTATIINVH